MKNNIRLFMTILLSLTVLIACNTTEEPITEPASDNFTANEKENEQNIETEQTTDEKQKEETTTNNDNSISYTSNGKQLTEKTKAIESDEQQYSIQVIPGFTLVSEEPGKDLLYYDENEAISMRIETFAKNNLTFSNLIANTEETIAAISTDGQYEPFDVKQYVTQPQQITNATAFTTNLESDKITSVAFETAEILVRLTIFDNSTVDLTEAMLKMGITVK